MTVIVGIYCSNGVVLASDSALTINSQIEQPFPYKISKISENFLKGFAGDLGYAQRITHIFKEFASFPDLNDMPSNNIAINLAQNVVNNYFQTNNTAHNHNIPTSILAAFSNMEGHHLVCFPHPGFQPIFINEKNSFYSIGSGHHITNPFLSFLKSVFWQKETLSLNDGIFAAIMSLQLAIEINAGGINAPICVGTLERTINNDYSANILDDNLLREHFDNTKAALEYFKSYKEQFKN